MVGSAVGIGDSTAAMPRRYRPSRGAWFRHTRLLARFPMASVRPEPVAARSSMRCRPRPLCPARIECGCSVPPPSLMARAIHSLAGVAGVAGCRRSVAARRRSQVGTSRTPHHSLHLYVGGGGGEVGKPAWMLVSPLSGGKVGVGVGKVGVITGNRPRRARWWRPFRASRRGARCPWNP